MPTTEKDEEKRGELLIWDVPPELKRKFKAKCAELGVSMKDTIIEFMTKFCK